MSIVEVKNLTKYYPIAENPSQKFAAVDHISFEIQKGETFGILGPNGAGKSTTLEMMEGMREINEGEVNVAGISVNKHPLEVKQVIGVQLQKSEYFDHLNLSELLTLFGDFYHRKIDANELLNEVQLTDKAKSRAKDLSGGQKQRLSIASALVNDPKVLFLDEPTTGLDPQARHNLWDLIRKIKAKGKTIVLTSHYMEEAQLLCDRIAIMDHAKIIALDTPANLIKSHAKNAHIIFETDKNIPKDKYSQIISVEEVMESGMGFELKVSNVEEAVKGLVELDKIEGAHLTSLQVLQPTLEDVFLKLTGRGLRE